MFNTPYQFIALEYRTTRALVCDVSATTHHLMSILFLQAAKTTPSLLQNILKASLTLQPRQRDISSVPNALSRALAQAANLPLQVDFSTNH